MTRTRTLIILTAAIAVLCALGLRHTATPARAQAGTTPTTPAIPTTPVALSGCPSAGGEVRRLATTRRKVVALTFDDGPSDYTPAVLAILSANHVPATFFAIGENMAGREALMRQMIAAGDEIGDHTWSHIDLPPLSTTTARAELQRTQAEIGRITGFTPCLFRPPHGRLNSRVEAIARQLGLRAILWSDDSKDFTMPGSQAIYSSLIAGARPGAILLMHDGGGNRSQTVAALPRVIATLKQRGYTFATVSGLLGPKR
jgi:peptidoglycan/xylan/chitin deacetylase (PgdA/CDA1 family)